MINNLLRKLIFHEQLKLGNDFFRGALNLIKLKRCTTVILFATTLVFQSCSSYRE